jgi:hypothetical protein
MDSNRPISVNEINEFLVPTKKVDSFDVRFLNLEISQPISYLSSIGTLQTEDFGMINIYSLHSDSCIHRKLYMMCADEG